MSDPTYVLNPGPYALKGFRSYPKLTEETLAFTASLTRDGKKVAEVKNDGHGGMNLTYFQDRAEERAFLDFARALPPYQTDGQSLTMDGDFFLSLLASQEEQRAFDAKQTQRWARQCRKATVFRFKGDKQGQWLIVSNGQGQPLNPEAFAKWVAAKHPGKAIEAVLNNLLPSDPMAFSRF